MLQLNPCSEICWLTTMTEKSLTPLLLWYKASIYMLLPKALKLRNNDNKFSLGS